MVDGEPLIDSSFMTFDDSSDWKKEIELKLVKLVKFRDWVQKLGMQITMGTA